MQKSETIFWSLVAVSAIYIAMNFASSNKVSAQAAQGTTAQPSMQGMGCMAKGGGCGCGGMMKRNRGSFELD